MENFGNCPPVVIDADEGEKAREEARTDRTFDPGECRHRSGEFDRDDAVGAGLAPA
jgi:hypothetical protein